LGLPTEGGNQQTKFIGEADCYRLILRSKAPFAERFQDWLCEEVLPSLREKGYYIHPGLSDADRRLVKTES
jgi:prophage antirepressor-like protein